VRAASGRVIGCAIGCAALVVLSGCLFGEVRGIPCDEDAACPEDYFCDVPRDECREITGAFGPAVITVPLLKDPEGDEVRTPFIKPDVTSELVLLPTNAGLSTAEDVGLTFGELACFTFDIDSSTLPEAIEPGARAEIVVDVTPGPSCEGLTIVDWFMTFSGRETRGVFDINVKP
jgi:hypothetical protein